jgi:hypothetical protein
MTVAEEHAEKLKSAWSGPMTSDEAGIVRDMQAFLEFCLENGLSAQMAFSTIAHDANNLVRQERAFLPKVSGYSRILRELHAAKSDPSLLNDLSRDEKWE